MDPNFLLWFLKLSFSSYCLHQIKLKKLSLMYLEQIFTVNCFTWYPIPILHYNIYTVYLLWIVLPDTPFPSYITIYIQYIYCELFYLIPHSHPTLQYIHSIFTVNCFTWYPISILHYNIYTVYLLWIVLPDTPFPSYITIYTQYIYQ
jgi:hypothetical protein